MLERTVLTSLLSRDSWLKYGGLFDTHFFSTETYRELFTLIKDVWGMYEGEALVVPREILFSRIEGSVPNVEREEVMKKTVDLCLDTEIDKDLLDGAVRDLLLNWRAKDYLVSAAQDLEAGGLDLFGLSSKFNSLARAVEGEREIELSLVGNATAVLKAEAVTRAYSTGLAELDDQLRGGLWAGEEGVLIAPSFRGKTWALVHFGAVNLKLGIPVQHHTLEISRRRVAIRYYQSLLGKSRIWIMEHSDLVSERLHDLDIPQWSVKDHSSGSITTAKIRKEVGEFVEACDTPPLIIIDYLDLVAPADRRLEGRFALTAVAQELREIAAEYDVGLWTATQANRPSWQKRDIRMSDVSEAIGKVEKADLIVTLNQTVDEKLMGTMRFYVDKARERVIKKPEVGALALSEEQQFADLPDGF